MKYKLLLIIILCSQNVFSRPCHTLGRLELHGSNFDAISAHLEDRFVLELNKNPLLLVDGRTVEFHTFSFYELFIQAREFLRSNSVSTTIEIHKSKFNLSKSNNKFSLEQLDGEYYFSFNLNNTTIIQAELYLLNQIHSRGILYNIHGVKNSESEYIGFGGITISDNGMLWADSATTIKQEWQNQGIATHILNVMYQVAPKDAKRVLISTNTPTNNRLDQLYDSFSQSNPSGSLNQEDFLKFILQLNQDQLPLWLRSINKTNWQLHGLNRRIRGSWEIVLIKR